jgi:hypothetical protein
MKGTKGVTISDQETTIADFAKQEITVVDTARKKFATIPASEFGAQMAGQMAALVPQAADGIEMFKSMKTTCNSNNSGRTETIQGIHAEERVMTCSMTMSVPDSVKDVMPAIAMKFVMRLWFASAAERVRVPGLWQLSGYELWQEYFMNPMEALGRMAPDGIAPLLQSLQKGQSATLRWSMEMSMSIPVPGAPASAADTPFMNMNSEVVELSTAPLDDSLFAVPADYSVEPVADVMNGISQATLQAARAKAASSGSGTSKTPIPENVKAYIPFLFPVTQTQPVPLIDASGKKVQGTVQLLVVVGPKGNVEETEVLTGPEELRKSASDVVRHWTFRPVIRNGEPVSAYTEANVDFTDYSKGAAAAQGFRLTPDMAAAQDRLSRLKEAFPRSPEQEFADLEQDTGGGDPQRRYDRLGELALTAVKLGQDERAKAYANQLLAAAKRDVGGWNYGNAIHDGHMVLGLVALRSDDISTADRQLLEAGDTTGSPQLNSFGPNMTLASELLKKGERNTVLDYFDLCRKFWKLGGARLDSWSEMVRKGSTPSFGANLR